MDQSTIGPLVHLSIGPLAMEFSPFDPNNEKIWSNLIIIKNILFAEQRLDYVLKMQKLYFEG